MNSAEIDSLIRRDGCSSATFLGVYPRDRLPDPTTIPLSPPVTLIVNHDASGSPGTHWSAMYAHPRERIGCYFDPWGAPPLPPFSAFLDVLTSGNWVYNDRRLQSALSTTCGQFCLVFVWHKCRDYPFADILDMFHDSQVVNDRQVVRFVGEHYGMRTNSVDMEFLGEVLGLY